MRNKKGIIFKVNIISVLLLTSCSVDSVGAPEAGALTGAALGAGLGAIVGSQSGHAGPGVAIGAGSGALIGGLLGKSQQNTREDAARQEELLRRQEEELERQRRELEDLRRQEYQDDRYKRLKRNEDPEPAEEDDSFNRPEVESDRGRTY